MTLEDREKILSNEYANLMIEYKRDDLFMKKFEGFPRNIIDEKYGVIYFPLIMAPRKLEWGYAVIPTLYGLLDIVNLDDMGVGRVQDIPQLGLRGEGVLLGFVDTGIDYTNPIFKNAGGTTRIISIWDQTIENLNAPEKIFYFGTEYTREQINDALQSTNPHSIVPSVDEVGHGTMLAGIAGGSRDENNNFQGVVPLSEFVVVKLKQAKQNLREYLLVPEDVECFQQDDIMFGIKYLMNTARTLNRPIVICIGLGTNQGGHDSTSILDDFISYSGTHIGRAFVIAGGNEGNTGKHYYGVINRDTGYNEVELLVGAEEKGFSMELWGYAPNTYSIDILSPSGQYVPQIVGRLGESREINFLFENTIVNVDHLLIESQTGSPFIMIRFRNPAKGSWKFRVYVSGRGDNLDFHIWLPMSNFLSPNTYFNNSNPYTTLTSPGTAIRIITVVAYNALTGGIYINSSRGYTRLGRIIPDLAAPGVNVLAPTPGNNYTRVSGTSAAAAHTAGLAAMIFEWGIVKRNYETMASKQIERFLLRGVETIPSLQYPNRIWGYGKVNIYNTFLSLNGLD